MPRENRKRGKKYKNPKEDLPEHPTEEGHDGEEPTLEPAGPSWLVQSVPQQDVVDTDAPFGLVETDVKAYFRTVDLQIRDWQENSSKEVSAGDDTDPNAERQMFLLAAMNEVNGKEKSLATDPECSIVLERMAHSMDDFVRRVFLDSLSGSWEILVKHRFASHVCQTMLTVAADTLEREVNGIMPSVPGSEADGDLRTMAQLILDICDELLSSLMALIAHPYASHVVRVLLILLSSSQTLSDEAVRSKKSTSWKAKQGPMKSVFAEASAAKGKDKEAPAKRVPPKFRDMGRKIIELVREELDDNELRALAGNKVASPALHVLLESEAELEMANETGSLLDRISDGAVTASLSGSAASLPESDYLTTLMRDSTSSRLAEIIFLRSSQFAFSFLWDAYLNGKLVKLANHPIANFVLSKAIERADEARLGNALDELEEALPKWAHASNVGASRMGVLKALMDRCAALGVLGPQILEAVYSVFHLDTDDDRLLLVPCLLKLQDMEEIKSAPGLKDAKVQVQGVLILQSLLRLPDSANSAVVESLFSLSQEDRLVIAHDPSASRVLDCVLESPTVPSKTKRRFILSWIDNYHLLVDDRMGSRVADRCWAAADTYLKEKIARSLIPQESFLAGSHFGKFFARSLNLHLLQRKPEEWKNLQSAKVKKDPSVTPAPAVANSALLQNNGATNGTSLAEKLPSAASPPKTSPKKRKREEGPLDEIDEVFVQAFGKKVRKSALKAH